MSKRNNLEQKRLRKQERKDAIPTPCLSGPTPLGAKIIRKLGEKPVDRVARTVVRCARAIRRAEKLLGALHGTSPFRRPLEADVKFNRAVGQLACEELTKRAHNASLTREQRAAILQGT